MAPPVVPAPSGSAPQAGGSGGSPTADVATTAGCAAVCYSARPRPPRRRLVPDPPATGPGGRPVNPFLSQDPSAKARRLARALVSDIVVYHPAKRQEGIRDGNLKELFEEEIKKSWEEYTEQVGREVAESTGYFREALNEILAGGRQLF